MKSPSLSICVCTHQGSERIEDTLWSLLCQSADVDHYEVLVVDNGSSDIGALSGIMRKLEGSEVELRLVVEPKIGLSHARNRAIEESQGDYVFFIDDDATAGPRLVESFLREIRAHSPDVIGGNVLPLFEEQPPPELDYHWWMHWSLKHFGSRDRWLEDGEYFLGTNVGALRSLLEAERFDPRFGRRGQELTGGEEWFLGDARYRRRFVRGATVFHQVPAERMTVEYLVRRTRGGVQSLREREGSSEGAARRRQLLDSFGWRFRKIGRQLDLLGRKLRFALRMRQERRRQSREAVAADSGTAGQTTGAGDASRETTARLDAETRPAGRT